MGTKERLAEGLKDLAQLVPGIASYQDKETLRDADKRLRQALADRLDSAGKAVDGMVFQIQRTGHLDQLDLLGRLERRLHGVADGIRFANYGYSGLFSAVKVDEGRIQRLHDFDIDLTKAVCTVEEQIASLEATPVEAMAGNLLDPIEEGISLLEDKVRERMVLFRSEQT
jgi:hypothetical protein